MPEPGSAQELRVRAARLRSVARTLDAAQVLDLHRRAGPDVWLGPTPQQCLDSLVQIRSAVIAAAGDLRRAARTLELRADQIGPTAMDLGG